MKRGIATGFCTLLMLLARPVESVPTEGGFRVEFDLSGEFVAAGGSTYNQGQWYHYPNTIWPNRCFYEHSFDPAGCKKTDVFANVPATSLGGRIDIAFNWSRLQYPPCEPLSKRSLPLLPALDPLIEDSWIINDPFSGCDYINEFTFQSPLIIWGHTPR